MDNSKILEDLSKRKKILETELAQVNRAIEALNPSAPHIMQWKERALKCIVSKNHIIRTAEILECLLGKKEVEGLSEDLRRRYITGISVALSDLWKEGKVMKFILKGFKGHYYALPNWLEGNHIKEKYLPSELKKSIEINMLKRHVV